MDHVKTFNNELSSVLECRPPISKAKMTSVTKGALKAIKLYKHVVQSVEKFIQKCKPEYKVPGLYVIDSIVRQSRHQHGPENDVFAPRFAKNLKSTIQNLFKCPEDQRPKIVRVLNLWQKNKVFSSDVIQPLLDMAHPDALVNQESVEFSPSREESTVMEGSNDHSSGWSGWNENNKHEKQDRNKESEKSKTSNDPMHAVQALLEHSQLAEIDFSKLDSRGLNSLQQLANQLAGEKHQEPTVKFNKELLDFDYGDEEEEEEPQKQGDDSVEPNSIAVSMAQDLLSNPELIRQLQQMQQTIKQTEALKNELNVQEKLHKERLLQQEEEFNKQIQVPAEVVQLMEIQSAPVQQQYLHHHPILPNYPPPPLPVNHIEPQAMPVPALMGPFAPEVIPEPPDVIVLEGNNKDIDLRRRDEDERIRTAEYAASRSKKRRHSPSPPPRERDGRRSRRSRSGSRSKSNRYRRDRHSRSRSRSRERDRERERERERERRRKGLPAMRKNTLSVCSTTLWLGHVPKTVPESEIHDVFGEFGTVLTIDIIPPRGCAYVCMDRRQDAYRSLQKLKNLKLQSSTIKMAWAPGKGMKGKQYKDYWDVDVGVSYIPFEKISDDVDVDLLEEGGMFDEDTIPPKLRDKLEKAKEQKVTNLAKMNTDDLMALVDAQPLLPVTINTSIPPPLPVSVAGTVHNANLPGAVRYMAPPPAGVPLVRPPQFAGIPPIPLPGQTVMVPGYPSGVRQMVVLPPTSSSQPQIITTTPFPPPIVGSLPMVMPPTNIIRQTGILPPTLMPQVTTNSNNKTALENQQSLQKPGESSPESKPMNDAKLDATDGNSLSQLQPNSQLQFNISSHAVPRMQMPPVTSMNLMPKTNFQMQPPSSANHLVGVPQRNRPPITSTGLLAPPNVSHSGPFLVRPNLDVSMQMNEECAPRPNMMGDPVRFAGMRFSSPRMPPVFPMSGSSLLGLRPRFRGDDMLDGKRPWMDGSPQMFPPPREFGGENRDKFAPDGPIPTDRHRMMEDGFKNRARGPTTGDWHSEKFDRYDDRRRFDGERRSRWEPEPERQSREKDRWHSDDSRRDRSNRNDRYSLDRRGHNRGDNRHKFDRNYSNDNRRSDRGRSDDRHQPDQNYDRRRFDEQDKNGGKSDGKEKTESDEDGSQVERTNEVESKVEPTNEAGSKVEPTNEAGSKVEPTNATPITENDCKRDAPKADQSAENLNQRINSQGDRQPATDTKSEIGRIEPFKIVPQTKESPQIQKADNFESNFPKDKTLVEKNVESDNLANKSGESVPKEEQ